MEDYSGTTNSDEREILSVTELNKTVNDFINEAFPPLWVVGEISNFKEYGSSGHWYFSVKDTESVLNCSMFRLQNISLGFKPNEGDQVIMQGKLSVWHKTGRYQMIVNKMELAGYGELLRKFELLKNKFNSEGLFNTKTENLLPALINRVAIVTSPHGAAVKDVIATLRRKAPHIQSTIFPAVVQGEGSANSIKQSLELIEQYQDQENFDAIIVCRGGGSIEDLWSFNNEDLCRYVSGIKIPIVSGVGHETDFTLMDFVSNIRAATPTAAAEIVSNGASQLLNYFEGASTNLIKTFKLRLSNYKEKVLLNQKLLRSPQQKIHDQYQRLDQKSEQMSFAMRKLLQLKKDKSHFYATAINSNNPSKRVAQLKIDIAKGVKELLRVLKNKLNAKQGLIASFKDQLNNLNPENVLERGYSITYNEKGKIIRDSKAVKKGDEISTKLKTGLIKSKIN